MTKPIPEPTRRKPPPPNGMAFTPKEKQPPGRRRWIYNLTDANYRKFLAMIRMGAYDYVAAQACGIRPSTFYRTMQRGLEAPRSVYGKFVKAVEEAKAVARTAAEMEVKRIDPKFWLERGPAKNDWGREVDVNIDLQGRIALALGGNDEEEDDSGFSQSQSLADALAVLEQIGMIKRTQILDAEVVQRPEIEADESV